MGRRRVYLDTEFTGLHRGARLISVGAVSDREDVFYAELTDYHRGFANKEDGVFLDEHVMPNLLGAESIDAMFEGMDSEDGTENVGLCGPTALMTIALKHWLEAIGDGPGSVEVWSDCYAYDWVLFCDLWGHALKIPSVVYYIPFDLATLLLARGEDPDVNREYFARWHGDAPKHNALHDARVIRLCVERLEAE